MSILYVDDGSGDASFAKIKEVSERADENEVHYISFARNFGKEAAIYAGLKNSTADYIALMDADLQHPPELLLEMVKGIEEGYECCGARRVNRNGEPPIRSAFSRLFYSMATKMTSTKMEPGYDGLPADVQKICGCCVGNRREKPLHKGDFCVGRI